MFAPKVVKPQTKAAEASISRLAPHRSTLAGHRLSHDPVEQALFLQRTIGKQATLRLQARRDSAPSGNGRNSAEEQEMIGENTAADKAPRSVSWNFSKISLFPPERAALALVHRALSTSGNPLDQSTQTFFEARFGHNLSQVRLHTGPDAAASARAVNAAAYAVGQDVVFGEGRYAPNTNEGKRLLAHELTHTLQQPKTHSREVTNISTPEHPAEREASRVSDMVFHEDARNRTHDIAYSIRHQTAPLIVQKDLLAYTTEHTEYLPTIPGSSAVTYEVYKADAAAIQTALQSLIAANKVGIRTVSDQVVFFSQGATRAEIMTALGTAGYTRASEMADALLDEHNLSIYSAEKITKMSSLFTVQLGKQTQLLERQSERPLTASEKTEAKLVFGNSLDLDKIRLAEDPILSVGGYARTTPWTINFPPGSFGRANFISWLIHELTHSWQYQHGVSLFTTIYYALTSDYKYGGEVGLRAAQSAGKKFTDFDTEQQGDILADYYSRVKSGANVSAWQPFVNQVQSAP